MSKRIQILTAERKRARYAAMTEEERAQLNAQQRERYAAMTAEQKAHKAERDRKRIRIRILTAEQKARRNKRKRAQYAVMTAEQKARKRERDRKRWAGLSKEKRKQILTAEQKARKAEYDRKRNAAMTAEERKQNNAYQREWARKKRTTDPVWHEKAKTRIRELANNKYAANLKWRVQRLRTNHTYQAQRTREQIEQTKETARARRDALIVDAMCWRLHVKKHQLPAALLSSADSYYERRADDAACWREHMRRREAFIATQTNITNGQEGTMD